MTDNYKSFIPSHHKCYSLSQKNQQAFELKQHLMLTEAMTTIALYEFVFAVSKPRKLPLLISLAGMLPEIQTILIAAKMIKTSCFFLII